MTSQHRLIALIVVWLAFGVATVSLFMMVVPLALTGTTIILAAAILALAAAVTTWFITTAGEQPA
jgi:hypothetical protein